MAYFKMSERQQVLIKNEIRTLAERGNITLDEFEKLYMNSYERNFLLPYCKNEVLLHEAKAWLKQISDIPAFPTTYNEAALHLLFPLLAERLQQYEDSNNQRVEPNANK